MAWEIEDPAKPKVERVAMSSVVPRRLLRWIDTRTRAVLPLGAQDLLTQFMVQTRLIFSRTILIILGVLFLVFCKVTIAAGDNPIYAGPEVFRLMLKISYVLAILTHMNIFGVERESRTAEILLMRMPSTHVFLRFKLRFSYLWALLLIIPLIVCLAWFVEFPAVNTVLLTLLLAVIMVIPALITCIVSTYVPNGIVALIISGMIVVAVMQFISALPLSGAFNLNMFTPSQQYLDTFSRWQIESPIKLTIRNLLLWAAVVYGLYQWLADRVRKTEQWAIQA